MLRAALDAKEASDAVDVDRPVALGIAWRCDPSRGAAAPAAYHGRAAPALQGQGLRHPSAEAEPRADPARRSGPSVRLDRTEPAEGRRAPATEATVAGVGCVG